MQKVCEKLTDSTLPDKQLLTALYQGVSVYFNYTGQAKCLNINQQADSSLGDEGWDYQVQQN